MMVVLNVIYKGENDNTLKFVEEVKSSGLLEAIRNEQGNLQYEYYSSLDNPNSIILIEHWSNAYDLSRHSKGENIKKIGELKDKYNLVSEVKKFIIE